jgi:hypothetical protein
MRCRIARKKLVEVELGLVGPAARAELDAHLGNCAFCATAAERERGLTADLVSLRCEVPLAIDVTSEVASRLATAEGSLRHGEVGLRQALAAAAAVAGFGGALLVGLWRVLPGLPELIAEAHVLLTGLRLAAANLLAPAVDLLRTVIRSAAGLLALLGPVAESLRPLQPVALATIAACTVMMLASIVLVVGRDLTRDRWIREESR